MQIALHHKSMMTIAYLFNMQSGDLYAVQKSFGGIAFHSCINDPAGLSADNNRYRTSI